MRAALVIALAASAVATGACAQSFMNVAPTDNDLRAAYCLETSDRLVKDIESSGIEGVISEAARDPRAVDAAASAKAQMDGLRDRRARLATYVGLRLTHINPVGLVAAMRRADVDFDSLKRESTTVPPSGTMDEQADRIRSCKDLSWLPF